MSREFLIAVVDDDESFRMALVDSLDSLGYGARGFASAEDFIAWEADASWKCVITDIHMPGMSGLDLARLLKGRPRGVPVVMVTAGSNPGIDDQAAAIGVICLLRKPFRTEALIDCVEKALKI
ncbi:response regulator [Mesorhizobium sp. M1C.F.Ca.ET.193.01.1.1]|uniref:response regulator transcription factor n=1 Tax=unclassified Mesorhizobium TaxID=325217 RepID=UPI000FD3A780|nr:MULTISPECIES: response regulator [unclassified Mesorhizobium]TGS92199.1 response regulator [bacterium M00.F.Ca.ET.177.01.1.1]TGQ50086.1 response regulator [Mesorhizobium sp. M1C.F.Ca.ET.210.01.1.1]TGQ64778.1 response regulator [Mesorhizobium sp. M1C.F.Ca.ET.212.01.1.1]TGQ98560.1 response regulator [Mesorhizobium sp. M1C.F.Ca.ET.204.01.1.1]TGR18697.1 response regulator [Mesorhizobium sp. M1C.F.Ca.ET.196.01.1.1]